MVHRYANYKNPVLTTTTTTTNVYDQLTREKEEFVVEGLLEALSLSVLSTSVAISLTACRTQNLTHV